MKTDRVSGTAAGRVPMLALAFVLLSAVRGGDAFVTPCSRWSQSSDATALPSVLRMVGISNDPDSSSPTSSPSPSRQSKLDDKDSPSLLSKIYYPDDIPAEEVSVKSLITDIFGIGEDQASVEEACRLVEDGPRRRALTQQTLDNALRVFPFVLPGLAYLFYDPMAATFSSIVDALSNRNWVAVDGGAYQAKIIAPAINGIVVPSVSILFATLIGTTISTLRQRQLDIRTSFNMEAAQLRSLQAMLDAFPPGPVQEKCRYYLVQYTSRIIAEGQDTSQYEAMDMSIDSELNGLLNQLNHVSVGPDCPPGHVMGQTYSACARLLEERSKRITAMQTSFPPLHYAIVTALATSILGAFLMETNQELLVFLNAVQLRLLWSVLVGTFSTLAIVIFDMINPFTGSYQITKSVEQLETIRLGLLAAMEDYGGTRWK